jgi:hypothetical protein
MTTQATIQTQIIGGTPDTNCDCCGRKLTVGVTLSGLGTFGADCIRKAMPIDRKRYSQGKPDANFLRSMAKMTDRYSTERMDQMGYTARVLTLALNPAALTA